MTDNQHVESLERLLRVLVDSLVDNPDCIRISVIASTQTVLITVVAPDGQAGLLIGRQGRTAQAIRVLLSAAGAKMGFVRVSFLVEDGRVRHDPRTAN